MTNIELFNVTTAAVFRDLYAQFPRPIALDVPALRTQLEIPEEDWWEVARGTPLNPIGCAIHWLRDEGFVRFTQESACVKFFGVVLTSKGFAALNRAPESLSAKTTVGDRLKSLSVAASTETVAALVRTALSSVTALPV